MSIAEKVSDSASDPTTHAATASCRTEAELLAHEMAAAEAAMRDAIALLPADLAAALDFRTLTRRYPGQAVGVAAGAGIVAGMVLAGRKRRSASEAASAHVQFSTGTTASPSECPTERPPVSPATRAGSTAPSAGVFAILTQLLGTLLRVATPLVVQWLRAGLVK